jgi:hypothetical protein
VNFKWEKICYGNESGNCNLGKSLLENGNSNFVKRLRTLLWEGKWQLLNVKKPLCGNVDGTKKRKLKNGNFFLKWEQNTL